MIIVSKNYKNCKANFSNVEVEFNEEFKAKVTAEVGNNILKSFPIDFWEDGKKPEPQVKKEEVIVTDNAKLAKLQTEIERLEGIIKAKDTEISKAKEGEQAWRDAYSKLQSTPLTGLVESKTPDTIDLEENKELIEEMGKKNFLQLKKWVKETFHKTDEELKDYIDKDKLIKFVLEIEI